jgi:L-asparaginase / beta-aspartyl-peptidase
MSDVSYSFAIHGGAGTILRSLMTPEKELAYTNALTSALLAGQQILEKNGSALDAVHAAVTELEDCPLFNAGRGSVFTHIGQHEMDASLMDGSNLKSGSVAGVAGVKNPITLARTIMEKSEHVLLAGKGAEEFARTHLLKIESDAYFHDDYRFAQWQEALNDDRIVLDHTEKKFGTVGAVARDRNGHLAAATSTGGMTNKKWGRIGDSPIIGAGTYANDQTCAISCTGHGEFFIQSVVAYDISCLMEYKGMTLEQACHEVVQVKLVQRGGEGGLIAIDSIGNICLPFNSEGMYRGKIENGHLKVSIYRD